MEHTDKMNIEKKQLVIRIIMIVTLILVFIMQVRIVKVVIDNKESLDADPLVFAAKKYNITSCSCYEPGKVIVFNQQSSKTVIYQKAFNPLGGNLESEGVNMSELSIKE